MVFSLLILKINKITLFIISSLEGWPDIMFHTIDSADKATVFDYKYL